MDLVVGRIGRPHGVRGDVSVDVRTDDPDRRFAPGAVVTTDPGGAQLTVVRSRWHHGRLLVEFEGCSDRVAAEALRGQLLVVDSATAGETGPDEYWDHQLVGLEVWLTGGERVGVVDEIVHLPGSELLAVRRDRGDEVLVPFVAAMVPEVDLAAGRVVVEPPPGLFEVNQTDAAGT